MQPDVLIDNTPARPAPGARYNETGDKMQTIGKIKEKILNAAILGALLFVFGTQAHATMTVNPTSVNFGNQAVGTTSASVPISLTNNYKHSITVSGASLTVAQFVYSGPSLPITLAPGGSLSASVAFRPAAAQSYAGTLVFTRSNGSTISVPLSGMGASTSNAGPAISFSPASLTFASQAVGTTSSPQFVTLTNTGNATLTFSVSASGDFALGGVGTCGSSVAAGVSCTISAKFTPTTTGTRTGALTLTDNASNSPQTISLTGTGSTTSSVAPSITTQPVSRTVTVGQTATFTVAATGTAPLTYQWKKSGTAITGAASSTYTTPATTTSDNGAQFTVVVSNSTGSTTSNAATLTVSNATQSLQITTSSLPGGQMQTSYSASLQAAGGTAPYAWSVLSGQLPNGLSLSNGTITGTPTLAGSFTFTIQVKDKSGATASAAFSISITTTTSVTPQFGHTVIVVEENTNYGNVVGSSSMPYLNSLMNQYGLATQYFANTHPSVGNYMMLATGQILTNDDSQTPSSFPVSADNIAREVELAGKTWKDYREMTGTYYVRHDPLAYMTNINSANRVSFPQFATDLANGTLPNFSWIVPNGCDDAHDCSLSTADSWLQTNIDPLIKNPTFQKDGLLIVVFDESGNDNTSGGGRVAAVLISPPFSHVAYQSSTFYQHESALRLMLEGLGIKTLPGAAATAPPMWEFFNSSATAVAAAPTTTLAISTTSLPAGTVGQGYNAQLNATGGTAPYGWLVASGSLPLGLTLSLPDAHLQAGSPATDTGLALPDVPVDYDGTTRPQGAGFDIGSFELHP